MAGEREMHDCEWKGEAERLRSELDASQNRFATLEHQLAALQRHVFGKRSEKMPRLEDELRRTGRARSPAETLKLRKGRREEKAKLPEREIRHLVPADKRHCARCGGAELRALGHGKQTVVYEYIPARFEKQVHVQETLSCRCGEGIVTAEVPKAIEKGQYGPGFIAHLVTQKCCDAIPLYRQAKALARAGVPIARTTMGDLFHAAAAATVPLYQRLLELIRVEEYVRADETPQRVLAEGKTKRGYVWTFRTEKLIAYVHSASRSGDTASALLAGTTGYLQVDGFTGYNAVTLPEGRARVGCWAHVRRKYHDAVGTAPEASEMLDFILELYRLEYAIRDAGLLNSEEHKRARREESTKVLARIDAWLEAQKPRHPPKSPLGEAIRYTRGQWDFLTRFVEDTRLSLDNNASERALRSVALGRKNYLFVGHDAAGANLAGLMSLLATCEANEVNPEAYLADVLMRVHSHPASRIDELLPHRWSPVTATDSS